MSLYSHGIDIVDISRIRELLGDHEFVLAWFTVAEQQEAELRPDKAIFYAGRIAAKEAVVKALGTGFTGGISPTDIEILVCQSGAPSVLLRADALMTATRLGIHRWSISISHSTQQAIASAFAVQD